VSAPPAPGNNEQTRLVAAKVREAFDLINASTVDCMGCDGAVVLLAEALSILRDGS